MDNEKVIFRWKLPDDYPNFSGHDDLPTEYKVVENKKADGGVVIFGKYNGEWKPNPWNARTLVRHLIECLLEVRNNP